MKHTTEAPEAGQSATRKTRTLTRPGHHRQVIHIPDAAWEKITAHVDANDLNHDRWLTKQMSRIADSL